MHVGVLSDECIVDFISRAKRGGMARCCRGVAWRGVGGMAWRGVVAGCHWRVWLSGVATSRPTSDSLWGEGGVHVREARTGPIVSKWYVRGKTSPVRVCST